MTSLVSLFTISGSINCESRRWSFLSTRMAFVEDEIIDPGGELLAGALSLHVNPSSAARDHVTRSPGATGWN